MSKSYITGSAIISSLGNNKQTAINKIKSLNDTNYEQYLNNIFTEKKVYPIDDTEDKKTRFYTILEKVIFDALNDANIQPSEYKDLHLFIGSTSMNISVVEQTFKETGKLGFIGNGSITSYIESLLSLQTPSIIFSTACTSSGNALVEASNEIKNNHIKKALVVGIELLNDSTYKGFNSLMLLSESGKYQPLCEESDGIVLGEACSAVILENNAKSLDDFYIQSSKNLFDSYSQTSANPNGEIIYQTMIEALKIANLSPKDLTLINLHTPGTNISNEAELNAILKLIKDKNIIISSMKPYIGHTLGACNLNEIVLLTNCIKNDFIPNTLGVENFKKFNFSKEKQILTSATLMFSNNGFSGNNLSIILTNKA